MSRHYIELTAFMLQLMLHSKNHLVWSCGLRLYEVRSPDPTRPRISVEKLALFLNAASGGTLSSTAIEIINRFKFTLAKAKVLPHLEAWVRLGHGIPHANGYNSTLRLWYSKE
jgi:hypothetical protein